MSPETMLDRILASKAERLRQAQRDVPLDRQGELAAMAGPVRRFKDAVSKGCAVCGGPVVIAEIKQSSPSAGVIHAELDVPSIARGYEAAGAGALSVLTEEDHFNGMLCHVGEARDATGLPVLRKDFVTDPYQIWESRAASADAVLLIARILDDATLADLLLLAHQLDLDALVEVHDEKDLSRALDVGASLVGVNNRDLESMDVDLAAAERLLPMVPPGVVKVAESGVRNRGDLDRMAAAGADAVLVGEAILRAEDPPQALAAITGHPPPPPLRRAVRALMRRWEAPAGGRRLRSL